MGLSPDQAASAIELRRRRDELMGQHHPDRGGDFEIAARINETYARMTKFINARAARRARFASVDVDPQGDVFRESLKATFHAGAAQLSALALVAAAGLAVFRAFRKK
jgi:hypothetical protein